ncbi:DUF1838 family protein [Chroococcidiopsis sp. FACHB-1243]|nr:DUF1838 family protein [Chroococcidiopsis sp. [FACHB-1243]]
MATSPALAQNSNLNDASKTNTQTLGTLEFVRTRCSTDGRNVYTQWQGSVYAFVPQEKQRKLFNIIEMNVARCLQDRQGQWFLTSRELNFYLDPQTNQVLNYWQNPWTKEVVPVVHVANNPVQHDIGGEYLVFVNGENVTFSLNIPLTYPNVLANESKFQEYSSQPLYQAGEFFKFTVPKRYVTDSSTTTVPLVASTWMRLGPWLPWMKMKDRSGQLVYSATTRKFLDFEELSPTLRHVIQARLPLYQEAPHCFLATSNVTSWTYFRQHFNDYLEGAQFPVAEQSDPPCKEDSVVKQ